MAKQTRLVDELSTAPRVESKLSSWEIFLEGIRASCRDLGGPKSVWFRGHWKSEYLLVPTLVRGGFDLEKERFLFTKYQQAAAHLHKKRDSDWETLFDMQHYGIPTRLLDWTETLGVAVFFALGPTPCESAVCVLNPQTLNKHGTGSPGLKRVGDPGFAYRSVYWEKQPFAPRLPIAMEPQFQNERLFAQRGVFTVHGDDPRGLYEQYPECVRKVLLPVAAREAALEFLDFANLNEFSVFPDIVGISRHLTRKLIDQ